MLTQLTGRVDVGDARRREHDRGRARARHRRLARRALEPGARPSGRSPGPGTSSRRATRACRPTSAAPRSTGPSSPTSTRSTGMPVVAAALHSQLPAVAVAFKQRRPDARLAYVMTDGAALPLALSDLVAQLRDTRARRRDDHVRARVRRRLRGGLGAQRARRRATSIAHADAAVVVMGPGIVGTATRLGFSRHRGRAGARRRGRAAAARRSRACARRSPTRANGTAASRTTARPRSRSRRRSSVLVPLATVGGDEEARLRADLADVGHRPTRTRSSTSRRSASSTLLAAARPARRVDGPARGRRSGAVRAGRGRGRCAPPRA